jgi:eukaryotic-like serine/threonine-protein kinase
VEPERWRKIEELYHTALDQETSRRAAFVEQECGGDESLRREVESLLAQDRDTGVFLEAPALDLAARDLATSHEPGSPSHPAAIGRYRIIRLVGEGGMGSVYEAEQEEPRRVVALKVIKLGLATPDRLRRFRQESQALARLQHPGIAQIFESNTADTGLGPQPFFAMEFIRGLPLKQYAEVHRLGTRQKLLLMVKICDAVQHAHQRGLIHRDLKPSNILVDETGQPKILDFGVARVTEAEEQQGDSQPTMMTGLGQLVGTLAYMSPEQVLGDPIEVDTRSDVYALGVILYELLSGRLPYAVNQRQLPEAVHTIREEEPASLSSVGRDYRGDIETLVGKTLEKDKTRRYMSAADLGADIQRYLNDEPIAARPPSAAYQLQKFARRHRGLMAGAAAVFSVLLAGIAVSTSQAIRANRAGQAALKERDRATAAEASAKAVSDFLQNDLLAQASASAQSGHGTKPDPDLKVRTALDRAAAGIEQRFDKQPLVEASIRQTIGNTYLDLGIFPEAQKQLERAVDLRRRLLGENHSDTLASLKTLGILYRQQGKAVQAEALLTKVLDAERRVLGEDHPATLESAYALALLYDDQEKFPRAESLLTRTLEGQRRNLGETNPSTALTMNKLAEVYKEEGKYAPAESLHTRALKIQRAVLGPEHPETLYTMNSLASLYDNEGKYPQAEQLFSSVLAVQRRLLGEEHIETLETMGNLGNLYRSMGRYAEAESLLTKTVEIQRRVLGEEHVDTMSVLGDLAALYQGQGKYAQAEPIDTKILKIDRRVLGDENPVTARSMNNLAVLYGKEGKWAQAEPYLANAVAIRRLVLGEEHPLTLMTMANLAYVYQMLGRYAQAEPLSTRALEGLRRVEGEEHNDTLTCTNMLGLLYRSEGKYAQAEPLLIKTLEVRRRTLGQDHPDTIKSMNSLADLYRSEGKSGDAETLLTAVLEARRRVLGPAHPDTISVMALLGEVRLQQRKYSEAEALLREARNSNDKAAADSWERYWSQNLLGASLAGQSQYVEAEPLLVAGYQGMLQREAAIPLEDRRVLSQAGERIVQLYESWEKPEKAAEWREKLQSK